jgi:hypothetical protein
VHGYLGFAYSQIGEAKFSMAAKHLAKSLELAGLDPKDGSSLDDWDMEAAAAIAPGTTRHSCVLGSDLRAGEACEPQL